MVYIVAVGCRLCWNIVSLTELTQSSYRLNGGLGGMLLSGKLTKKKFTPPYILQLEPELPFHKFKLEFYRGSFVILL